MGVVVRGVEGKGNFLERNIASSKIEPGSRCHATMFFRDLLKALVSLLCSIDLGVYYSCSVRNSEGPSGSQKVAGS